MNKRSRDAETLSKSKRPRFEQDDSIYDGKKHYLEQRGPQIYMVKFNIDEDTTVIKIGYTDTDGTLKTRLDQHYVNIRMNNIYIINSYSLKDCKNNGEKVERNLHKYLQRTFRIDPISKKDGYYTNETYRFKDLIKIIYEVDEYVKKFISKNRDKSNKESIKSITISIFIQICYTKNHKMIYLVYNTC